jgi:hypothetical protein
MAFDQEVLKEITAIAKEQGIEPAALAAVVEVESSGRAFTTIDGQPLPLILYEFHVFYRWPGLAPAQRKQAVAQKLAAPRWGDLPYPATQKARYNQLGRAARIDPQAAHAACSWGVGQVLGENAEWLGYGTPKALAERTMEGLAGQIEVMLRFVERRGLMDAMARRDWRHFARLYNGPGQVDFYAPRMAAAYRRHGGAAEAPEAEDRLLLRAGMRGEDVARLQRMLRGQGFGLVVDGDFGPATDHQLRAFQAEQGLDVDGIAGPLTMARLEALAGRGGPVA